MLKGIANHLFNFLSKYVVDKKPAIKIGGEDNPYLIRWHLIPRNRWFNIYLHQFKRDDDDRAMHDHPWISLSFILKTGYIEHLPKGKIRFCMPGNLVFRMPSHIHRIELFDHWEHEYYPYWHPESHKKGWFFKGPDEAWSIFITGPKVREWGFHCPKGFVEWWKFVDMENKGLAGPGCEGLE